MNVEQIRAFCLSLPKVTEDLKWGNNLCFLIGGKIFCLTDLDSDFSAALKVEEEDFDMLTARDEIMQAPHFARKKWVTVTEPDALRNDEWLKMLRKSYELVRANLSKRIRDQLLIALLFFAFFFGCTPAPEAEKLLLAEEMNGSLKKELLDAWYPVAIDTIWGGFFSDFTYDWQLEGPQNKMLVTLARHIWTTSNAAMFYDDDHYCEIARHGYHFLRDRMWDTVEGGFYMLLTQEGTQPVDSGGGNKNAYSNAFAIYALSAYYECSGDTTALDLALKTFYWLNDHCYDPIYKGYFNNPLWKEPSLAQGSSSMITSTSARTDWKDQNSSIHLLEAFTALYSCWPVSQVKQRLTEMLYLVRDSFAGEKGYLVQFMQRNWVPVSLRDSSVAVRGKKSFLDHVSFGHDVEAAYLMLEASHVLALEDEKTLQTAKLMVDHALAGGWDDSTGGFYYEGYYAGPGGELTIIDSSKAWWVQAEGLNSLMLMSMLFPDEEKYYKAFRKQWQYISSFIIDHEHGGWYPNGLDSHFGRADAPKGSIWKVNYHDSRALMNCIRMLRGESELVWTYR